MENLPKIQRVEVPVEPWAVFGAFPEAAWRRFGIDGGMGGTGTPAGAGLRVPPPG